VIKEIKLGYVIEKNKNEIISECCSTLIINIIRVRSMYVYKKNRWYTADVLFIFTHARMGKYRILF